MLCKAWPIECPSGQYPQLMPVNSSRMIFLFSGVVLTIVCAFVRITPRSSIMIPLPVIGLKDPPLFVVQKIFTSAPLVIVLISESEIFGSSSITTGGSTITSS